MNTRCPFWSKSSNVYSPSESLVPAFAAYRLYQFLYAHTVGEGRSRLLFSDACLDESLRQFLHDLHPLVLTFAARIFPDAHTVTVNLSVIVFFPSRTIAPRSQMNVSRCRTSVGVLHETCTSPVAPPRNFKSISTPTSPPFRLFGE